MLSSLDLLPRSSLRVTSFTSTRKGCEGTSWFIEDTHGPIEVFSTKEEAEAALCGERKAVSPLVVLG